MINKQNRSKVFIAIIGILLVANIAMVSFFLLNRDCDKREKRPDRKTIIANFLRTEIGFDTLQLQQYDSLGNRHKENMKKMMDSLRGIKDNQFKELTTAGFNDSAMDIIADRSSGFQKAMELRTFNHIKKVRLICTPAQQSKFDSLFGKILNRRGSETKKKQPGK